MQYRRIVVDQFGYVIRREEPGARALPSPPYSRTITINTADRDWQVGEHYGSALAPRQE